MDPIHLIVLALVQGLTEILPVSSSAHLALVPILTGWPDQGLSFDVALHIGTTAAVIAYFRQDLTRMSGAWLCSLKRRQLDTDARLVWGVLLGTIPGGLAGLAFEHAIESSFRNPILIASTLMGFSLLLWAADMWGRSERGVESIGIRDALLIGVAQAMAVVPGVSRSGASISAGLALGLTRQAAARFSFLLSVPLIVLAGALEMYHLARSPEPVQWGVLASAAALSGICAYLVIGAFLKFLARAGMLPFVLYRIALGFTLLMIFL